MEFGVKLRQAREACGMTQQSLADKLYVTRQAVSRWECGARYPDLMTAKQLSDILQVSMDELLGGEEFREYAEKQPVLETRKAGQVQTVLFTALSVLCLLSFSKSLLSVTITWLDSELYSALNLYILWKDVLLQGILSALSLVGAWKAFHQDTTPKIVGNLGAAYFLLNGTQQLVTRWLTVSQLHLGNLITANEILSLLDFAFALCIWLYFCRKAQRLEKAVCILGILAYLWRFILRFFNLFGMFRDGLLEQSYYIAISYLSQLSILGTLALLIVYEARVLHRKRLLG